MVLAVGLAAAGMSPVAAEPAPSPVTPNPAATQGGKAAPQAEKMSSRSQELLIEAQSAGKARVTVMTLAEKGKTKQVVDQLKGLGASVGYVHDKIGYVRASVPTRDALKVARIAQVKHVDLDEVLTIPQPIADKEGKARAGSGPWTGPNEKTPAENPYMPTADTGAVRFKKSNPEYDGRGVTIGILDSGVDLDHPALKKTTTGEHKIVNWITATDPLTEGDGTWRAMNTRVKGPQAKYGGATWKLPDRPDADFAINVFRESVAANNAFGGDVDRDGKTGSVWGILYDYKTGDIWVDVNGNRDFTDDKMMRPYKERYDVGHFGVDNPDTSVYETTPFVVEFRKDVDLTPAGRPGERSDFVNIGMVSDAHGTHVAGIAAGKMPGWIMEGAAPGAKIVSSKACTFAGGCTTVALTEGMIELVANQRVDIVNMSIGGLPALNDGNNTRGALYNRLIDEYGVQLFISAGNEGPGVNTLGDPSVATDVVSVAAGASKDTWLANYGAKATAPYWVQNYSSHGPREDGGFKPNLLAPGSAISSVPMFMGSQDLAEVSYKLPIGLAMFNGTSMSSPQATGASSLLLSAARQNDIAVTPKQLRASLYSTATLIKDLEVAAQGNGLMQIDKAWEILKKSPKVENSYAISAPVCTPLAKLLAEPGKGQGLYNRCPADEGGHKVGQTKTYDVTITRTAGPAGDVTHKLNWVGNDGTFSSPGSVDLPVGKAVKVKVTATPQAVGNHSAILNLDREGSTIHAGQMMADVVVATPLETAPFTSSTTGSVERVRYQSIFVSVPKGAKALQVNLAGIANGSAVRFLAVNPYGLPVESSKIAHTCYTNIGNPALCRPTSRAYLNPMPGVWEITVDASRRTPTTANPFRVTTSVQGVEVDPATQTLPSVALGKPQPVKWSVKNLFGEVTVSGKGGPLGSSYSARPRIKSGEVHKYTVKVPAGMSKLDVKIGNTSDKSADLDLVVKDSAGKEVAKSAKGDSEESVTIPNPKADTYTVEIDGYAVNDPKGTEYDYLDVFFGHALGQLTVDAKTVSLKNGAKVEMTGALTAKAAPTEKRKLFGELQVVNSEGAVLGVGQVIVGAVAQS